MKLCIIVAPHATHQVQTAEALVKGMRVHGDVGVIVKNGVDLGDVRRAFDGVCTWGWRKGQPYRISGLNVLVMERAYVRDRFHWVSLGWNGLNGRAKWPTPDDGRRWQSNFADLVLPWNNKVTPTEGCAVLMGQVPSDTACQGIHLPSWLESVARSLKDRGWDVRFRPHPRSPSFHVPSARTLRMGNTLQEDLATAAVAVTYNSNSGVDAVLRGIRTVAYDMGSTAWDVTTHTVESPLMALDRTEWCTKLAWRQWTPQEIENGTAWPHVKAALYG